MATAVVCFNPEHDIAAIRWDRRPNDFPVDAVNKAREALYHTTISRPTCTSSTAVTTTWACS